MNFTPLQNNDIFSNPLGWTKSFVGTKLRYLLFLILLPGLTLRQLSEQLVGGLEENWITAVFIVGFQFMLIYSLRATYLKLNNTSSNAV